MAPFAKTFITWSVLASALAGTSVAVRGGGRGPRPRPTPRPTPPAGARAPRPPAGRPTRPTPHPLLPPLILPSPGTPGNRPTPPNRPPGAIPTPPYSNPNTPDLVRPHGSRFPLPGQPGSYQNPLVPGQPGYPATAPAPGTPGNPIPWPQGAPRFPFPLFHPPGPRFQSADTRFHAPAVRPPGQSPIVTVPPPSGNAHSTRWITNFLDNAPTPWNLMVRHSHISFYARVRTACTVFSEPTRKRLPYRLVSCFELWVYRNCLGVLRIKRRQHRRGLSSGTSKSRLNSSSRW